VEIIKFRYGVRVSRVNGSKFIKLNRVESERYHV